MQIVVVQAPPASEKAELNVLVGTWNVGNERPPTDLSAWLTVRESSAEDEDDDDTAGGGGGEDDIASRQSPLPPEPTLRGREKKISLWRIGGGSKSKKKKKKNGEHSLGVSAPDSDAGDCVPTVWGLSLIHI